MLLHTALLADSTNKAWLDSTKSEGAAGGSRTLRVPAKLAAAGLTQSLDGARRCLGAWRPCGRARSHRHCTARSISPGA